jgi:hypothetical protein
MKTPSILTTALCLGLMLTGASGASLLQTRAKLEGARQEAEAAAATSPANAELAAVAADKAQALANFDAAQAVKFGANWITRWQNSNHDNPDDEAVDIYINDGPVVITLTGISPGKKRELLAHIATKPVLASEDLSTVMLFRQHNADLADRIEEFAALLPSNGVRDANYFRLKHLGLAGRAGAVSGKEWYKFMSTADWFDLASANAAFTPDLFVSMRNHLLAQCARLLIEKRKAAGQSVEGPEFDAAIAPVVTALDAPKFDGLATAVDTLGISLAIPAPDYSAQESIAEAVASAAASKTRFTSAWGAQVPYQDGLGSVMFVKGKDAYTAWRDSLLANP